MNEFIDPFKVQDIRVAVDAVCIAIEGSDKYLLLIKREYDPFKEKWALPGGFIKEEEDLDDAVCRELEEETGVVVSRDMEIIQIGAFGEVGRDPRPRRVISIAFLFMFDSRKEVSVNNETLDVRWVNLNDLSSETLAFDHWNIIQKAIGKNTI